MANNELVSRAVGIKQVFERPRPALEAHKGPPPTCEDVSHAKGAPWPRVGARERDSEVTRGRRKMGRAKKKKKNLVVSCFCFTIWL